jgi:hypothetical protein
MSNNQPTSRNQLQVLQEAILTRALFDLRDPEIKRTPFWWKTSKGQLLLDAANWIWDTSFPGWPGDFTEVCLSLGLEPNYIREQLSPFKPSPCFRLGQKP